VGVGSPRLSSLVDITPEVVVAIDTSGSMTQQAHAAALGELNGVLRALNLSVTLITCDARVHEAREVRNLRDALPLMKGGGGTDFDPIFAHVAKMKQRPDLLVVLTDGICESPTVSLPGVRVLWVIIGTRNELKPGRNIFIPSNEEQ
jgi:predicted metal-dependent peptidase